MNWVHLQSQKVIGTDQTDKMQIDQTQPPKPEQMVKMGWRIVDAKEPALAAGDERLYVWYAQDPNRTDHAIIKAHDRPIADRIAAEQAQQAQATAAVEAAQRERQTLEETLAAIDGKAFDEKQGVAITAIRTLLAKLLGVTEK